MSSSSSTSAEVWSTYSWKRSLNERRPVGLSLKKAQPFSLLPVMDLAAPEGVSKIWPSTSTRPSERIVAVRPACAFRLA